MNEINQLNTEEQVKQTALDFMETALANGSISEHELAECLVRGLDNDTDMITRYIKAIRDEHLEWVHDWYEKEERSEKQNAMLRLDRASDVPHEHYERNF